MTSILLLSGGAAQGLVTQLEEPFQLQFQCTIDGSFGSVGMMKDSLLAGTPCDVVILTEALITMLTASGELVAGSARALGVVKTGIAVKEGDTLPALGSPAALKAALQAAKGIYFPDPLKATAGIHFMSVLMQLELEAELADRLHSFPNGATAMNAMAEASGHGLLGCTQVTEILYTAGVQLVAPLPLAFELVTAYTAAVCTHSLQPQAARDLIGLMVGADAAAMRLACGFE